nr:TonB-dependent receptor [uncultured Undibacterium sp.]
MREKLNKNLVLKPIAVAILSITSVSAFAQSTTAPEVVITGNRIPTILGTTQSATRTDTPIEFVPQSIVAISRSLLDDQGITNLNDALRNVSNVNQVDPRDANNVTFKIRGFNSALVVDGIAMPGYFHGKESLINVERIDVLKGPAGGLFGSSQGVGSYGTLGGTIAITTNSPQNNVIRQIGVGVGSYGARDLHVDLNQPISKEWAFRIVADNSRSDSESQYVNFKNTAVFPSLSWTPSADTKVILRLRYLENTTKDYGGLPQEGTLVTTRFTLPRSKNFTASGIPDTVNKSTGFNLNWTTRLNANWTASLVAAKTTTDLDQRGTYVSAEMGMPGYECFGFGVVGAKYNFCGLRMWEHYNATAISPSLTGKLEIGGIKHTINLGLDWEKTYDNAFMLYSNMMGYIGPIDLTSNTLPAWSEPIVPGAEGRQRNIYQSRVAYIQDQMQLGDLHVTAGVRQTKVDVTDVNPDPMFAVNNISSNSKLTSRIGAAYQLTPGLTAFAGFNQGMKVPTVSVFAKPPKPETSTQKELGIKLSNFSGLTATLAWFDLTRQNAAVTDPMTFKAVQTGEQESKGVDLDLQWRISPEFSVLAAFSSQKVEVTKDTNTALLNKQLFNVPKKSGRIAARYDVNGGSLDGLGLGLGLSYHDKLPGNNTNDYFTTAATVFDAQVSYRIGKARYGLNVVNLANRKYYEPSSYFLGGQVTPAAPRTVMATAVFDL